MDSLPSPACLRRRPPGAAVLAACLLLALPGCADDEQRAARAQAERVAREAELPAPERTAGSVTGMPATPGPGTTPIQSVGGLPAGSASISTASVDDSAAPDPNAPDMAFEPAVTEVPPIASAPVDPRTGMALQAGAPEAPEPARAQRRAPATAPRPDPDATASTTIVVDVPAQDAAPRTGVSAAAEAEAAGELDD